MISNTRNRNLSQEKKSFVTEYQCKKEAEEDRKSCSRCEFRRDAFIPHKEIQLIQGKTKVLKYSHVYIYVCKLIWLLLFVLIGKYLEIPDLLQILKNVIFFYLISEIGEIRNQEETEQFLKLTLYSFSNALCSHAVLILHTRKDF